jgi:hypothetical protein
MRFNPRLAASQKFSGLFAMVMFLCALAALVDAMVGGLAGNSGTIELIPGERFQISGPMPQKTEVLADFVIEGEPEDGAVQLLPEAIFSGYWFGGAMWRGVIVATASPQANTVVIRIRDRFGEKQNPALVFTVKVYPDVASKQRNSPSFLMRQSGINPFSYALVFLLGGILSGATTYYFGKLWAKYLGERLCGEIYILKKEGNGAEATCELSSSRQIDAGTPCALYRRSGEMIGTAHILEQQPKSIRLRIDNNLNVEIGDIACLHSSTAN